MVIIKKIYKNNLGCLLAHFVLRMALSASSSEKVNRFNFQRSTCSNNIKEAYSLAVKAKTDNSQIHELKSRYEDTLNEFSKFQELHNNIIILTSVLGAEEFSKQDEVRATTSKMYYGFKAIYFELVDNFSATPATQGTCKKSVRLEPLGVRVFSGDYKEWRTFFDMFNSCIHSDTELSDIDKFRYLLKYLDGEPLALVRTMPLTGDNYPIAYNALVKKYENHRLIATNFWNEIYFFPALKGDENLAELSKLLNTFSENLEALRNLQYPVDEWDFVSFHLLLYKLPGNTRNRFELEFARKPSANVASGQPSYKDLYSFLETQLRAMQTSNAIQAAVKTNSNFSTPNKERRLPFRKPPASPGVFVAGGIVCSLCREGHSLISCSKFLAKNPHSRFSFVKSRHLCLICFGPHGVKDCTVTQVCGCGYRHNKLLHFSKSSGNGSSTASSVQPPSLPVSEQNDSESDSHNGAIPVATSLVSSTDAVPIFPTAIVKVKNSGGIFLPIRVLLDSASAANFISEGCLRRLGLPREKCEMQIAGIGNSGYVRARGVAECIVKPQFCSEPRLSLKVLVLPEICCQLPLRSVRIPDKSYFDGLELADSEFWKSRGIDMLIGVAEFGSIVKGNRISSPDLDGPVFLETIFGWVALGKSKISNKICKNDASLAAYCSTTLESLDENIKRLWEVESVPNKIALSPETEICENLYKETHVRNASSRYVVALPFRVENPNFGESRNLVLRRLYSLESRLYKNPDLLDAYRGFMREYLEAGYMSPVRPNDEPGQYYIPHHCVIREESISTKLRVVFDSSMKSSNGVSLNSTLYAGPKLHSDISAVLLNFRLHKYVLIADIKKMFLQILVREEDRKFQHILWRFDRGDPVQEYILDTLVFGVSSSPYLANRTIRQLAMDERALYPIASDILLSDIYVDDILTGFSNLEMGRKIKFELTELLKTGGFELRKWASNCAEVLSDTPLEHQQPISFDTEEPSCLKVLGLQWQPAFDSFTFKIGDFSNDECTKRSILSNLARIFDPLGMIAPLTLFAKCLIQELWRLGLDWNQESPPEVTEKWRRFQRELSALSLLKIPRNMPVFEVECELHGFCDASQAGYGCVVFLRVLVDTEYKIYFVSGKSKVAPLKRVTLPRLELCAAVLLSNLVEFVRDALNSKIVIKDTFAWSDSRVALAWIKSSAHRWQTFISNRVSHVQDKISPENWRHVPTSDNPADCASRGLYPSQMLEHPTWFAGPSFLLYSSDHWPADLSTRIPSECLQEEKNSVVSLIAISDPHGVYNRYSSLEKILRIIAFCLRFPSNIRRKQTGIPMALRLDALCEEDLNEALLCLVKQVQREVFSDAITRLSENKSIDKVLRKLNPFIDPQGFLRVGGRLTHSRTLSYEKKFPLLLPQKHRLTELIIFYFHKRYLHPGLQTLHFLIMQQFWILSAKNAIRRCLSCCVRCFRVEPKPVVPYMGDLPAGRVSQAKAFQEVGVDFAGPFFVTPLKGRGIKAHKAYACIFVCFAVKALHLELVSSLSSDAFIGALKRFIARRGRCSVIRSDCGTNFIGANRQMVELMKQAAEEEKIRWCFNPPSAPNFGGLWEAGVRSMKHHLIRSVGLHVLTFEEMYTVLCCIESVLNSRPLHPVSSDPNDITALTPGHFLTLEPLTSLPSKDYSEAKINTLQRWELVQRLHGDFWKRWHHDYLNTLQQRSKWTKRHPSLKVGDMVVIKNELNPPLRWLLARVTHTHPGADGICRVATVKTKNGFLQRPVSKLCPLPYLE